MTSKQTPMNQNQENNTMFKAANNWAIKNPKIFWPVALIGLFFGIKLMLVALEPNPSWCDCDKAVGEAIQYSVFQGQAGSTAKYDESTVKACARKVLKVNTDLNIEPEELSLDYILQFSSEICTNGYYEGKGSDNRGKKYYPNKD